MNLIYILGLEHSGTTMTDQLLGRCANAISAGEVTAFFSPSHMTEYVGRWGKNPVSCGCSCGKSWEDCDFWGDILNLNGLYSNESVTTKYLKWIDYVNRKYGKDSWVIDSSKNLDSLGFLINCTQVRSAASIELSVVLIVKDVRNYAFSMKRKQKGRLGWRQLREVFEEWRSKNEHLLEYLKRSGVTHSLFLYDNLCADPFAHVEQHFRKLRNPVLISDKPAEHSHIAMGNKDFITRSLDHIHYDDEWKKDTQIKLLYALNPVIRRLNQSLRQHPV